MANHELPVALRRLAVRLLLVVATGTDNVNANALVGYFMLHSIYEPIMKVLIAPTSVPGGRAFPKYFPQLQLKYL